MHLVGSRYRHDPDIYGTQTAQQRRTRAEIIPTRRYNNNLAYVELVVLLRPRAFPSRSRECTVFTKCGSKDSMTENNGQEGIS